VDAAKPLFVDATRAKASVGGGENRRLATETRGVDAAEAADAAVVAHRSAARSAVDARRDADIARVCDVVVVVVVHGRENLK
jgi:hypothetical protein